MGLVESEIIVNSDPASVFRIAQEVEKYPDFMPDVESARIIERRDDGYAKVAWVAHAKVASIDKPVKWIEESWWDEKSLSAKFNLLEGDYTKYEGDWEFTAHDGGTKIKLKVDYNLGLPLIGPLIVKLLDRIMQNNLDGMLGAIKKRAEEK
ncbi:MAG: SRPBCC family protein [bacterium]